MATSTFTGNSTATRSTPVRPAMRVRSSSRPSHSESPRRRRVQFWVAEILAHELVHAAVGVDQGHGPAFRKVANAIGLEGKLPRLSTSSGKVVLFACAPRLHDRWLRLVSRR